MRGSLQVRICLIRFVATRLLKVTLRPLYFGVRTNRIVPTMMLSTGALPFRMPQVRLLVWYGVLLLGWQN